MNNIKFCYFLFLILTLAWACESDDTPIIDNGGISAPTMELGECYTLPYQESVVFEEGDVTITFDSLVEDSRCPVFGNCIWEGRAWVQLQIEENNVVTTIDLITENSQNQDSLLTATYGDYIFVLKDVKPEPMDGAEVAEEDYEVVFSVEDAATYHPCKTVIIDENIYENVNAHPFFWVNASIDDDCLDIEISAAGCDGSTWQAALIDSGAIAESLPEQRYLKFRFINEELCTAQFTQIFHFDLVPLRTSNDEVLLNLDGWEEALLYSY